MANKGLFANFLLFSSREGHEATSPSFTIRYALIQASSALLETLIASWYVQWDTNWSTLTTVNKCLFSNLLLFASGEGDKVASPSFTTSYMTIEASSASLKTLIASWYMQWGCKREHSTHGKQIPICQSLVAWDQRGRRDNVALFCTYEHGN